LEYKRVGDSCINVSRISLGTNNFGGQVTEQDAITIIKKAIDLGVNSIDTANVYTGGLSEKIIGKALEGYRDDIILATKVGMRRGQGHNQGGLSRKNILSQISKSLENLKTDFIDLYYLHRFDPNTQLEETLKTLNELVREEKVRYIACSNFTALQIAEAQAISDTHGLEKLVAVQPRYNLLQREIENSLLPYCEHEKMGVLTYSPLMGGFLTGKYKKDQSPPKKEQRRIQYKILATSKELG
jgi:aryl-alcohol dehydrogenase-like predicted oxidoreductase